MENIHPKKRYSQSTTRAKSQLENIAQVAVIFGFDPKLLSIKLLAGGFMNANYFIQDNKSKAVLRVSATNYDTTRKEGALLNLVRSKGIKAPKCIDIQIVEECVYALHEFVSGITLEEYLLAGHAASENLFFDIGSELAKVHSVTFENDGILGANLKISQVFLDANEFVVDFMKCVLKEVPESRLPLDLNRRFLKLIETEWSCVKSNSRSCQLTHLDFNPKNILVNEQGELLSILDWEFGMSLNGLADLGNFFRFSYDYPKYAKSAFVHGYKNVDPSLPDEWEKVSLLLDLGSMCGFLERKEDYPETFRTARTVIAETLLHFGY